MKKFLLFLIVVVGGVWAADFFGYYKFPWSSEQAVQTVQRAFGRGGRRQAQKLEEVPVLTAAVRREDVPITLEAVGTVQALNNVIVRAQVEGRLLEIAFKDGQDVKKGDVLARIDPRTYQAQYDQAVAKKSQNEATLANARIDLNRYSTLAAGNFGSRQQADTQKALVAQLEAQVRVDQALVDQAKAVLDYTTIIAPIDGRTGLRAVDAGNIIRGSDANGLVTITQLKPIAAIFSLPQQQLRAVSAGVARGKLVVQALDADNVTLIDTGQVEVIDNQVDPTTGTVRIKTIFPNADLSLWPGQFVNVRLFVDTLSQVAVVPTAAVQRGPKGTFVYVVTAENKAVMTAVVVQRQDEKIAVIQSGVAPPARVVTTGFAQLTDGAIVKPAASDEPAAAPVAAAPEAPMARPPGERRGPGAGGPGGGGPGGGQGGRPRAEGGAPGAGVPGAGVPGAGVPGAGGGRRQGEAGGGQGRRPAPEGGAPAATPGEAPAPRAGQASARPPAAPAPTATTQ